MSKAHSGQVLGNLSLRCQEGAGSSRRSPASGLRPRRANEESGGRRDRVTGVTRTMPQDSSVSHPIATPENQVRRATGQNHEPSE